MKKYLYLSAAMSMALFACTDDKALNPDDAQDSQDVLTEVRSNLTSVNLATFDGDQSRVSYNNTRAGEESDKPLTLELIATIENPDKEFSSNYNDSDKKRHLSATSVYRNPIDHNFYVTYHMQGNNYNTDLDNDIAGAIQVYSLDDEGTFTLGKGFMAEDRNREDYDFNHLYFDRTANRIIVVGHKWKAHKDGSNDPNKENTTAIIGVFDPNTQQLTYSDIVTDEKEYDSQGKSLGYKDARDANCVVRANDAGAGYNNVGNGWDFYMVATRKGLAVLNAKESDLFKPVLNEDGSVYFIQTPGSAKFIAPTGTSSYYGLLYLSQDKTNESQDSFSEAKIARLSVNTNRDNGFGYFQTWNDPFTKFDPQTMNLVDYDQQIDLPSFISPIDGKNTLVILGSTEFYAALGTGGIYCVNGEGFNGFKKFDNRPVNCVAVDNNVNESGHSNKGYLYVANGAKLTILKRDTLKEVASYNLLPENDDDDFYPSANYIHVENTGDEISGTRIVTVAYGQAGVKVFKFNPPVK